MPEILTESFCERCGTRYTFEAAIPKKRRIGKLKVLSKGLKNYVLSDDASLDEALAEARSEEQRELTGGQLDAFHQAFQFCMSCRQYTCSNCWNEAEGRCLSCAPLSVSPSQLRSPLDDLLAGGGMAPFVSQPVDSDPTHTHAANGNGNGNGHALIEEPQPLAANGPAWPTIDLFRTAEAAPSLEPLPGPVVAAEPEPESWPATEPAALVEAAPVVETEPVALAEAPVESADFWAHPFTGFAPVIEPTNGHDPDAPVAAAAATDAPTVEDAPIAEPDLEQIARAVSPLEDVATAPAAATYEPAWPLEVPPAIETSPVEVTAEARATLPVDVPADVPADIQVEVAASAPAEAPAEPPVPVADPTSDVRADELAARTSRLLGRLRVQPRSAASAVGAQPEPVVEARPEPPVERAAEPEPEPVAELAPEPEPELAPEPEPVAELAPEPTAYVAPEPNVPAIDRIEMPGWPTAAAPAWRSATPPVPAIQPPPAPSVPLQANARPARVPGEAPQWPAPLRPGVDLSVPAPWASRAAARDAGLWIASAQEVTAVSSQSAVPGGVQSCVSCGLSLSATARFCRRCGSPQG
jgi:hypothetical protein